MQDLVLYKFIYILFTISQACNFAEKYLSCQRTLEIYRNSSEILAGPLATIKDREDTPFCNKKYTHYGYFIGGFQYF